MKGMREGGEGEGQDRDAKTRRRRRGKVQEEVVRTIKVPPGIHNSSSSMRCQALMVHDVP